MSVIETERLLIRRLKLDDAEFILRLLNEPSWIANIGDKDVHTLTDAKCYLEANPLSLYRQHGYGLFMVETQLGSIPVGLCGLINRVGLDDVDLGFALLEEFWGQGFAYEAALATMAYGKTYHSLSRLVAITLESNLPCINLLKKLKFEFEGTVTLAGDTEELQLYSVLC